MDKINVLSLFDGISCGKVALERAGIKVDKYYASEIDKFALAISSKNHPDIIQLGDITKWEEWDIEKPDLIIGGSPCTSLSIAKRQKESGLEKGESTLFWVFNDIVKYYNPKYFLLENVASMKNIDRDRISDVMGVEHMTINSALLSAQMRKRHYWFNWNRACLRDYFECSQRQLVFNKPIKVGLCGKSDSQGNRVYHIDGKSVSLVANGGGKGAKTGLYETLKGYCRKLNPIECERLQTLPDNYTQIENISDNQRIKTLGNGWTVDVIAHILKGLNNAN